MSAPFSVLAAKTEETPVIVEVPHAGLSVDGPTFASLTAPARCIGRDADLYVDELYADVTSCGATLIVSHVSRYVVDLNRSESDVDSESVEGVSASARASRGIIWRLSGEGGRVLSRPLPTHEFQRRLTTYYRPYHRALAAEIERKRARFGFAVVLAAHSMPSVGRTVSGAISSRRADVVPGTRGRTSAAAPLIDLVEAHARREGLSVAHDDPYQGGFTTQHYGRPDQHVHVVQVELARRLYMDELTLSKHQGFDATRAWCTELVDTFGRTRVAPVTSRT